MISEHLGDVSKQEGVETDKTALNLLAQAADGSMRDALSLLDQAIAFGNGKVLEAAVSDMLGSIPKGHFSNLVSSLAKRDAIAVMEAVAGLAEQSADFNEVLTALLSLMHQVALYQSVPKALDKELQDTELISMLAEAVSPEDIQLYYQIALMGRRDLPLIPDPKAGLEMILLRMLSFQPLQTATLPRADLSSDQSEQPAPVKHTPGPQGSKPETNAAPAPVLKHSPKRSTQVKADGELDWPQVLSQLGLKGVAYALASNLSFKSCQKGQICLVLEEQHAQIRTKNAEARLQKALSDYFSEDVRLRIDVEAHAIETPSQLRSRNLAERQQAAEQAIAEDLVIQGLKKQFGAKIVPGSVKPLDDSKD
jgi:DNA polymerase-3 subunit gamma/tau